MVVPEPDMTSGPDPLTFKKGLETSGVPDGGKGDGLPFWDETVLFPGTIPSSPPFQGEPCGKHPFLSTQGGKFFLERLEF
jgi:hypothetical protein